MVPVVFSEEDSQDYKDYVTYEITIDNFYKKKDNILEDNEITSVFIETEPNAPVTLVTQSTRKTYHLFGGPDGTLEIFWAPNTQENLLEIENNVYEIENYAPGKYEIPQRFLTSHENHKLKIVAGDSGRDEIATLTTEGGGWCGFEERSKKDNFKIGDHKHFDLTLVFDPLDIIVKSRNAEANWTVGDWSSPRKTVGEGWDGEKVYEWTRTKEFVFDNWDNYGNMRIQYTRKNNYEKEIELKLHRHEGLWDPLTKRLDLENFDGGFEIQTAPLNPEGSGTLEASLRVWKHSQENLLPVENVIIAGENKPSDAAENWKTWFEISAQDSVTVASIQSENNFVPWYEKSETPKVSISISGKGTDKYRFRGTVYLSAERVPDGIIPIFDNKILTVDDVVSTELVIDGDNRSPLIDTHNLTIEVTDNVLVRSKTITLNMITWIESENYDLSENASESSSPENEPESSSESESDTDGGDTSGDNLGEGDGGGDNRETLDSTIKISGNTVPHAPVTITIFSKRWVFETFADKNGYFEAEVSDLEQGEHTVKIAAGDIGRDGEATSDQDGGGWRGFEENVAEDKINSGESKHFEIPLEYNPFEVSLSSNSGTVTRRWVKDGSNLIDSTWSTVNEEYDDYSQFFSENSTARMVAGHFGGTVDSYPIESDAWIVSWQDVFLQTFDSLSAAQSAEDERLGDENVVSTSIETVEDYDYLIEWTEGEWVTHREWYETQPPDSVISDYGMSLIDTRPDYEYEIEWEEDVYHEGYWESGYDYKVIWTTETTSTDTFETQADYEFIQNDSDKSIDSVETIEEYDTDYLIEWETSSTESGWFDDSNDHSGTVIDTRTEVVDTDYVYREYSLQDITDTYYLIEWTTSDTDYKIQWTTTTTTTHSSWFDDSGDHSGTVIDTRTDVVDMDYVYNTTTYTPYGSYSGTETFEEYQGSSFQEGSGSYYTVFTYDHSVDETDTDYLIEWTETTTTTHSSWFDDSNDHSGTVIDTRTTTTTHSSWFDDSNDHSGTVVNTRTEVVGQEWVYQGTQRFESYQGDPYKPSSRVKYEFDHSVDETDTDYLIEWTTTETHSDWFDDSNDHSGTVIDTRTEVVDTDYRVTWTRTSSQSQTYEEHVDAVAKRDETGGVIEEISDPQDTWVEPWTETVTKSDWFDTRNAHEGTVVDTRESGTYDYLYEWETYQENTYSDWFDTQDAHSGTVVAENLVDTDYLLSWTENFEETFPLSEEEAARQLQSQVNGPLTTGQAYVGDYDYGVTWEGPAVVERVQENVYSATYTQEDWSTETTTVTVTAKNNYSGGVNLSPASDSGVSASLGDLSLALSSSAQTSLTMLPTGGASTHSVTVMATDPWGKGKESATYTLNLAVEDEPSETWTETSGTREENLKASTSLTVKALKPIYAEAVGRWNYEEFPATVTVNGETRTTGWSADEPGYYGVEFGGESGLVPPGPKEVYLHPGEDKSVVGRYDLEDRTFHDLRINLDPSEGGSTDPAGDRGYVYEEGTAVGITATPNEGWNFSGWSGDASGSSPTVTVAMLSDKEITAHFMRENRKLAVESEGPGSVTLVKPDKTVVGHAEGKTYTFPYESEVELTGVAYPDATFVKWVNPESGQTSLERTITVNMKENATWRAQFKWNRDEDGGGSSVLAYIMVNRSVLPSYADYTVDSNKIIQGGYVHFAPFQGFLVTDSNGDGDLDSIYNIDGLANLSASGGLTESSIFNLEPDIGDGSTWGLNLTNISAKWDLLNAPSGMSNAEVESVWSSLRYAAYSTKDTALDLGVGEFFDGFDEGPTEDYSGSSEPNLGDFDCGDGTTAAILGANAGTNQPIVVSTVETDPVWQWLWDQANKKVGGGW